MVGDFYSLHKWLKGRRDNMGPLLVGGGLPRSALVTRVKTHPCATVALVTVDTHESFDLLSMQHSTQATVFTMGFPIMQALI